MRKKLIIPTIAATVLLTGCSTGGLDAIQADVELLKREVAELKAQIGGSDNTTAIVNPSNPSNPSDTSSSKTPSSNGESTLGQPIVVKGVTYTVTEAERKPQLTDSIKANDGYEFAIYNVHIHNTSNEDHRYSQSYFDIVTSSGEIIDSYLILDLNDRLDELGSGELASSGQRTGWIAFEVPQGDQPLEIRFEEISFAKKEERAAFKVKLR